MNVVELALLAALWGGSFLFMRIGAPEFGPVPLVAVRVGIAALVLLPALRSAALRGQIRDNFKPLSVVGMTNSAIPFCLFSYSMLSVSAGFDAILNATTPLWGAMIAFFWLGVPLGRAQLSGLVVGFTGVALLVWDQLAHAGATAIGPTMAPLAAALLYGFAANYSKQRITGVAPLAVAWSTMFSATVPLLPLAVIYWPAGHISLAAWLAVLGLGTLCTGIAYVLYFRLIERAGAAYAMSVTFLVPVFGMLWGALFLHERITAPMVGACAVILAGTALATGKLRLPGLA